MQLTISLSTVLISAAISMQASVQSVGDAVGSSESRANRASTIFVDATADPDGDGSASAPYQSIARALERAREMRGERQGRITVHVAAGSYVQQAPLYLNVSNFELRGATQLVADEDGLPLNCGTDAVASPCIESGSETTITPAAPLITGQVLLVIAPTRNGGADNLSDVSVRGFVIDGLAANVGASGTGIFVDRTSDFSLHGNVTRRVLVGVLTRLASGTVRAHFAYDSMDGLALGSGSAIYPASVDVIANRLTNNRAQGALALGGGGVRARITAPDLLPVQTLYDRIEHPEAVPDTLAITLRHNDISRNGSFGMRFEAYSANNSFYDTVDAQPMTAVITADVRGNAFVRNGEYGLTVEGAFATRTNPRVFTGQFDGRFEANDLTGNGRAGLFVGFMLNGVVTRNPGLILTNKYLVDSRFAITSGEALADFDYDNPALDPFDGVTPLNNVLTVNRVSLTGRHVTCPPGFPCVQ